MSRDNNWLSLSYLSGKFRYALQRGYQRQIMRVIPSSTGFITMLDRTVLEAPICSRKTRNMLGGVTLANLIPILETKVACADHEAEFANQ